MFLLRYLYVVALVLWVGGLIAAGALVAPSVFGVLQAWNATEGRVLAGQVFGEVLLRLTWLSYVMAAIMFTTLTLHRLLGARPLRYGVRVGIMSVMLVMMFATGFYIIPQVEAIQATVNGPVSALPVTDARVA
jgi:cytochrome c oxidase assembly factor CtaG